MINTIEDALKPDRFPQEYQQYFEDEALLVRNQVYGKVLDIGCGKLRILPQIHEKYQSYIGIDSDQEVITKQNELITQYPNAKLMLADARKLSNYFGKNEFDVSLCLWNTIHIIGEEKKVLQDIANITKDKIVITLAARNPQSFTARKNYYKTFGIEHHIEEDTQTIYSDVWGESKAYTLADMESWSKETKLKLAQSGDIGYMGIYGIFKR